MKKQLKVQITVTEEELIQIEQVANRLGNKVATVSKLLLMEKIREFTKQYKNYELIEFYLNYSYIKYLADYFNKELKELDKDIMTATFPGNTDISNTLILVKQNTNLEASIIAIINDTELDNYNDYTHLCIDRVLNKLLKHYNITLSNEELLDVYNRYLYFFLNLNTSKHLK